MKQIRAVRTPGSGEVKRTMTPGPAPSEDAAMKKDTSRRKLMLVLLSAALAIGSPIAASAQGTTFQGVGFMPGGTHSRGLHPVG